MNLNGIQLISGERLRQFSKGHSVENDIIFNQQSQLISAIMLLSASLSFRRNNTPMPKDAFDDLRPETWDREKCVEYIDKSEIDQLKMIGAFAAAEIDRLQNS